MRLAHTVTTFITIISLLLLPSLQLKVEFNQVSKITSIEIANSLYASEEEAPQGGTYQGKKPDESAALVLLTMLAVAVVSVGLFMWCPNRPTDVWLAIGAGVIYLGGELYSMMQAKKIEYNTIEYDGTTEDPAVKTLKDEKKSYEDLLKISKMKKNFQMAAAAGYAAAAAMAAYAGMAETIDPKNLCISNYDLHHTNKGEIQYEEDLRTIFDDSEMSTFSLVMLKVKYKVQKFINKPTNRSILFGGFAALTYMAMKKTEEIIKTLEENIATIEEILANLKARAEEAESIAAGGVKLQGISMIQVVPLAELEKLGMHALSKKLPCVEKVNGKCVSVAASIKNDQRTISLLGSNFAGSADLIGSISDQLQGSQELTERLLSDSAKLAGQGALVKRKLKEVRKLLNDHERKNGKIVTNFGKEEGKFTSGILKSVRSSLNDSGISADKLMGISASKSGTKKVADKKNKEKEMKVPTMKSAKGLVPVNKNPQFDFTLDEEEGSGGDLAMDIPSTEDFDIVANDIEQRKDVSIFKQISTRYIRTAIPLIFEKSAAELTKEGKDKKEKKDD